MTHNYRPLQPPDGPQDDPPSDGVEMYRGDPMIDAMEFESMGDLMVAIGEDEIKIPCWIAVGKSRHRITAVNQRGIFTGLLIALEMKAENERN
jgi:hypothetical protein